MQPYILKLKVVAAFGVCWLILALTLPTLADTAPNRALVNGPLPPEPPLRAWTVAADGAVFVLDAANVLHHLAATGLTSLAQSAPLPLGAAPTDAPAYLLADATHLFVSSPAVSQTLVLARTDFSQVTTLPHAGPMALDPDRHLFLVSARTGQLLAYNPANLSELPQGIPVDCIPVDLAANPTGRRLYVHAITSCGSSHHGEGYFVYDLDTLAKIGRVAGTESFYWVKRPAAVEGTELGAGVHVPYAGASELLIFDGQGRLLTRQNLPQPGMVALAAGGDWLYLLLRRGLGVMRLDDLSLQSFLPFTSTVPNDLALSPDGGTVYLFATASQPTPRPIYKGGVWPR